MASSESMKLKIMENTELIKVSDDKHKYINTSYKKVSAKMFDYKCDIKLQVDKETFRAHKDVLADASDYFSAMFSHDMIEKEQEAIEMHEISPKGFRAMLEYFYHGYVTIDPDNIEDVIEAARFFFIEWMVQICVDFLIRHFSMENFPTVLELADKYCLGDLRADIFKYVGRNFVTLARQPKFMQLSQDLLTQLLADDYFIDAPEHLVFNTVARWLEHDMENRKEHKIPLLQLIRYTLLDPSQVDEIPQQYASLPDIKPLISEANEYNENPSKQCIMTNEMTEMRGAKSMLLLVSALDDAHLLQYKPPDVPDFFQEETSTNFLKTLFEHASTTCLGNFLFMAGGYDRSTYTSSDMVYRYNPRDRSWMELASMNYPRVSFAFCAGQKTLYAVAGINRTVEDGVDKEHILKSVESYDPNTGSWSDLPELPFGCFSMAASVCQDKLFICGGISDNIDDTVPTQHLLACSSGAESWERLAPMLTERKSHTMTPYQNKLYVFGGQKASVEDIMELESIFTSEEYDIETNQWTRLCPSPRDHGPIINASVAFNSKIFLLSGDDTNRYLLSYKVDSDEYDEGAFCGEFVAKLGTVDIALPFDIE